MGTSRTPPSEPSDPSTGARARDTDTFGPAEFRQLILRDLCAELRRLRLLLACERKTIATLRAARRERRLALDEALRLAAATANLARIARERAGLRRSACEVLASAPAQLLADTPVRRERGRRLSDSRGGRA
jgi:hypothetical protein